MRKEILLLTLIYSSMLDFFNPIFQADATTLAIAIAGVITLAVASWFLYKRFFSSSAAAKQEDLMAPSTVHFQAPPEADQPTETPHDEQVSEHSAPNQDTPE